MKKIIIALLVVVSLGFQSKAQQLDYAGYLNTLDTLSGADTTTKIAAVVGAKSEMTFQINTTKIGGTGVTGTIKIYGSVDGTNYATTPIISDTLVNQTNVYKYERTSNGFAKWKVVIITATGSISYRVYLLYRKEE